MTKQDYQDLKRALDLLSEFIDNFSGDLTIEDDRGVLASATDVLNGYVSTGGEI